MELALELAICLVMKNYQRVNGIHVRASLIFEGFSRKISDHPRVHSYGNFTIAFFDPDDLFPWNQRTTLWWTNIAMGKWPLIVYFPMKNGDFQ